MRVGVAALIVATGVTLDLATKAWARASLEPYGPAFDFLPFVSLHLTFNEGVSFTRAVGQEHGFVFAFEPAAARQVPAHAMRDGVGDLRQLRRCGRTGAAQARLAPRGLDVRVVHAVEPQHVEVNIQVQRAAEALDQGHHAALRRIPRHAGLIGKPTGDHTMHDAQHRADRLRLAGEQEAQRVRKTQHPLPHRPRAKHLLHQVPRALGHAPRPAARAQPALLASRALILAPNSSRVLGSSMISSVGAGV